MKRSRLAALLTLTGLAFAATGCGGPPPLHAVRGKVTLKGKGYERLSVHFRPLAGDVTMYNMAVGETDKDGNFKSVAGAGGNGLQAGEYKVTFTFMTMKSGKAVPAGEKPEERGGGATTVTEMVGKPYDLTTSMDDTPVRFTVKPGDNEFTFDIPNAAK